MFTKPTMNVFVSARDLLKFTGVGRIESPNKLNKIESIIIRRIICLIILLNVTVTVLWFILFEAKTFSEYANPIFVLLTNIACILLFQIFVQQSHQYENLFDHFHSLISERMLFTYFIASS